MNQTLPCDWLGQNLTSRSWSPIVAQELDEVVWSATREYRDGADVKFGVLLLVCTQFVFHQAQ